MGIRRLAAVLLAGLVWLVPLEARRHTPKVHQHATAPRPKGRKAKKFKARKVKPPKGRHFTPSRPKPPKVPRHRHG